MEKRLRKPKKDAVGKRPTLEAKRFKIAFDIANGEKYTDIVNRYVKEWDLSVVTVQRYIADAVHWMSSEDAKNTIQSMNISRLEGIIKDSIADKDRKNAIRAIDAENKMIGAYTEKVELQGDNEINLVFNF